MILVIVPNEILNSLVIQVTWLLSTNFRLYSCFLAYIMNLLMDLFLIGKRLRCAQNCIYWLIIIYWKNKTKKRFPSRPVWRIFFFELENRVFDTNFRSYGWNFFITSFVNNKSQNHSSFFYKVIVTLSFKLKLLSCFSEDNRQCGSFLSYLMLLPYSNSTVVLIDSKDIISIINVLKFHHKKGYYLISIFSIQRIFF